MTKWISVKDRLPKLYEPVLITYIGHRDKELHCDEIATKDEFGDWIWWDGGFTGEKVCVTVTHWMPLPEPPKEGE